MPPHFESAALQIDILAGHVRSGVSGHMTFNGLPLRAAEFQKRSCYVLQRDVLLATATVCQMVQRPIMLNKMLDSVMPHLMYLHI